MESDSLLVTTLQGISANLAQLNTQVGGLAKAQEALGSHLLAVSANQKETAKALTAHEGNLGAHGIGAVEHREVREKVQWERYGAVLAIIFGAVGMLVSVLPYMKHSP